MKTVQFAKMLLLLQLSMDFNSDWFILWIQSLLTILLREISKFSILGKYGLFGVKTVKFTKSSSSPSVVDEIQFWLIYFVDPTTVHNSSSQNFKIFNFWRNCVLFGVKTVKFTKNVSFSSGISGILFWLIYFVDPTTFHNSSSRNLTIFNFGGKYWLFVVKTVKFAKMLLLIQLLMEFNSDWFILLIQPLFTILWCSVYMGRVDMGRAWCTWVAQGILFFFNVFIVS